MLHIDGRAAAIGRSLGIGGVDQDGHEAFGDVWT